MRSGTTSGGMQTLLTALALTFTHGCRSKDQARSHESIPPSSPQSVQVDAPQAQTPSGPPLTREEVRLVVRAKMPEIRACFEIGQAEGADSGRVLLRFTIGADGRPGPVQIVDDQLGAPAVASCLAELIPRWQFPRPPSGQALTITYPFVFSSEQSLRAAGLPRVEGTVKPAAVGAVFEARRAELDGCVAAGAKGTIGLAFMIDDAGAVTRISTYANTLGEHARGCVISAVSSWVFPTAASGDQARVNHDLWWW
jgi:TonB family protein